MCGISFEVEVKVTVIAKLRVILPLGQLKFILQDVMQTENQ